jgi:hypothetical protein
MTLGMIHTALQGLQANQRRFERAASDVVRTTAGADDGPDPATAAVDLMRARRGFEACLAVASAGEEMLGRVIDELA